MLSICALHWNYISYIITVTILKLLASFFRARKKIAGVWLLELELQQPTREISIYLFDLPMKQAGKQT